MTEEKAERPDQGEAVVPAAPSVVRDAPAAALGAIWHAAAHTLGMMMENAVAAQQQGAVISEAAANQGVMQIFSALGASPAGGKDKA